MDNDLFPDYNIGPAELRTVYKVSLSSLLVRNIWKTYQGEMPFAGKAAIFVRLGGCNRGNKGVHCGVFCDTDFRAEKSTLISVNDVCDQVKQLAYEEAVKLVVITGGEPLMQPALHPLCVMLLNEDYNVQIESNGDFNMALPEKVSVVISPKAHGMKAHGEIIENEVKAAYFDKNQLFPRTNFRGRIDAFRFVVHSDWKHPHFLPPKEMIEECAGSDIPIYLSPMTIYNTAKLGAKTLEKMLSTTHSIGWPANPLSESILNYNATKANYEYAVKLSSKLRRKGFDVSLSMQSHLFFGVE